MGSRIAEKYPLTPFTIYPKVFAFDNELDGSKKSRVERNLPCVPHTSSRNAGPGFLGSVNWYVGALPGNIEPCNALAIMLCPRRE